MHICLFTSTFLPKIGGAQQAIARIAHAMTLAGHRVTVLAQRASDPQKLALPTELPYTLRFFPRPFSRGLFAGTIERHLEALHRVDPIDAVQAQFAYYPGWIALRWSRKRGIPLAVISHGGDIVPGGRYLKRRRTADRIREVLRETPALIAISRHMRERMTAIEANCGGRIDVIPLGLPDDWPPTAERVNGLPERFCAYIGRFTPDKGVHSLIAAFARAGLAAEGLKLVLVGDGPYRPELERLAAGASDIHFTGELSAARCIDVYRRAAFCVFPSRIESFGLGPLEAVFCGTPVLANDNPAYREMLKDCPAARLVDCSDLAAFAAALRDMSRFNAPDAAALEPFRARYRMSAIVRRHIELFERQGIRLK